MAARALITTRPHRDAWAWFRLLTTTEARRIWVSTRAIPIMSSNPDIGLEPWTSG